MNIANKTIIDLAVKTANNVATTNAENTVCPAWLALIFIGLIIAVAISAFIEIDNLNK